MFLSKGFRLSALLATLVMAFSLAAVDTAEARRGGSFGSRGARTQQVVPATPVSPKTTAPVERSMNERSGTQSATTAAAAGAARPSLFGGLGGAMLGGLLFSGLFGMMFGYGFGGAGGMLALLVQLAVVGLVIAFFMRRRMQPAAAGGAPKGSNPLGDRTAYSGNSGGTGRAGGSSASRSSASQRAGRRDEVGISDADLSVFQSRLEDLQAAYAREDYDALRRIATSEAVGYLAEELAQNASKGLRNEVYDVRLLEGDVAEAWREGDSDYATVTMRYESRDVMRDRTTGALASGEDTITETTEIWTFRRTRGGHWVISAIQEA